VLSDLAGVLVTVEWDRPAWRVRWVDGPTRTALMRRALELDGYRMGAPLSAQELMFSRSSSAVALAIAWLTLADQPGLPGAVGRVEQVAEDTGYPQLRVDDTGRAAADLLSRLAGGQSPAMGRLLAAAYPPVAAVPLLRDSPGDRGPGLQSAVAGRWPTGIAAGAEPIIRLGQCDCCAASRMCAMRRRVVRSRRPWSTTPVLQRSLPRRRPPGGPPARVKSDPLAGGPAVPDFVAADRVSAHCLDHSIRVSVQSGISLQTGECCAVVMLQRRECAGER
jgi:hypothetical protein